MLIQDCLEVNKVYHGNGKNSQWRCSERKTFIFIIAEIEAQYPGASVVNERFIKCTCGREIQLNKPRVPQSFASK